MRTIKRLNLHVCEANGHAWVAWGSDGRYEMCRRCGAQHKVEPLPAVPAKRKEDDHAPA